MERIIKIVKTIRPYKLVEFPDLRSYYTNYFPTGMKIEDILYKYGYSIMNPDRFYLIEESELSDNSINNLKTAALKISILEKFENAVDILKSTIIERTAAGDIYNGILMRQVGEYENNKTVGSLLEAELQCSKFDSYESLIEYFKLKYSDASELFAYVCHKNFEIQNALNKKNFTEANEIVEDIFKKLNL